MSIFINKSLTAAGDEDLRNAVKERLHRSPFFDRLLEYLQENGSWILKPTCYYDSCRRSALIKPDCIEFTRSMEKKNTNTCSPMKESLPK